MHLNGRALAMCVCVRVSLCVCVWPGFDPQHLLTGRFRKGIDLDIWKEPVRCAQLTSESFKNRTKNREQLWRASTWGSQVCLVLGYAMVKNTVCRRVWDQVSVTPGSIYTAPLPVLPVGFDLLVNRENPKMLSTRSLPPGRAQNLTVPTFSGAICIR